MLLTNTEAWLHGVTSAFITGAAGAFSASLVAPETFNLHEGWRKLLTLALANGLVGAAAYLKASPLPAIREKLGGAK